MGFDSDTVERQVQAVQPGGASVADVRRTTRRQTAAAASGNGPDWYQRMVQRRRRPHTPGVWVMYYALAALPLFGVGQWLIPAADTASRWHAFRLICVYVACALGLLLTTSFLGLRRYLRQRNLQMPVDMAGMWLGLGAVMIVAVLLVCLFLPRPGASLTISQLRSDSVRPINSAPVPTRLATTDPSDPNEATRTNPQAQQHPSDQSRGPQSSQSDNASRRQQPQPQQRDSQSGSSSSKDSQQASKSPSDESRGKQEAGGAEQARAATALEVRWIGRVLQAATERTARSAAVQHQGAESTIRPVFARRPTAA